MIEIKCKNCGSHEGKILIDVSNAKDTYLDYLGIEYLNLKRQYRKCDNCGLVYRTIALDKDEKNLLYKHYRDEVFRNETKEDYFERITSLPIEDSENYEKCKFLDPYITECNNKKILDVGCGAGVFLYSFSRIFNNWKTVGVEPTKDFSDVAKSRGINILNEYLGRDTFSEHFGLITLHHVMEHLDDYFEMLNVLKKYMSTGSILYIEVPSDKDIGFLSNYHDRFMCHHEVIFSESVLIDIVESAGFSVIISDIFLSKRKRYNLRLLLKNSTLS